MLKTTGRAAIDALFVESGEFRMGTDGIGSIMLTVVYLNSSLGASLGNCRVPDTTLSTGTIEAFEQFIKLAEQDFGRIVFDGTEVETPVEDHRGLPKGLGELA